MTRENKSTRKLLKIDRKKNLRQSLFSNKLASLQSDTSLKKDSCTVISLRLLRYF